MEHERNPDSVSGTTPFSGEAATFPSTLQKVLAWFERFKRPVASVAAVGAVASGLAGYWTTYRVVNTSLETGSGISSKKSAATAGPLSIVVLPFSNMTGDVSQEYVADGLTDSITSDLSRIDSAFVVSATTAQAYKGKTLSAQKVGTELGVRYVLRGTVQRNENTLRINAQLTDAGTNALLWSQTFDGETTDLFALQDRVTSLIGNSMGRELLQRAAKLSEGRKGDPTVGDLILRMRAMALAPQSIENFQAMQALARRALVIEPGNVEAMVLLAGALAVEARDFGGDMSPAARAKAFDESSSLVDKVAAEWPEDRRVYAVRTVIALGRHDPLEALHNAQITVELAPRSPSAHSNLGFYYYVSGQPELGEKSLLEAIALFPSQPSDSLLGNMCRVELILRRYEKAVQWCLKYRDANPRRAAQLFDVSMAYLMSGNVTAAKASVAAMLRENPKFNISQDIKDTEEEFPKVLFPEYENWYLKDVVPAMRLAGLPE